MGKNSERYLMIPIPFLAAKKVSDQFGFFPILKNKSVINK